MYSRVIRLCSFQNRCFVMPAPSRISLSMHANNGRKCSGKCIHPSAKVSPFSCVAHTNTALNEKHACLAIATAMQYEESLFPHKSIWFSSVYSSIYCYFFLLWWHNESMKCMRIDLFYQLYSYLLINIWWNYKEWNEINWINSYDIDILTARVMKRNNGNAAESSQIFKIRQAEEKKKTVITIKPTNESRAQYHLQPLLIVQFGLTSDY